MKKNSKDLFKEIDDFFEAEPSSNQKAWSVIHEFFNLILNHMESKGIKKADLAKQLGKSRSAISQMLNGTPNITVKKMVEIADAIGISINITSPQVKQYNHRFYHEVEYSFAQNIWANEKIEPSSEALSEFVYPGGYKRILKLKLPNKTVYSDSYLN